jgi:hypothetical protein
VFLDIPKTYYKTLREQLKASPVKIKENLDEVRTFLGQNEIPF